MKITALIENKARQGLACEHGLAVHIEFQGINYLLDTGASDQFVENAKQLSIDLSLIKVAFLSHSHYDHSGGYHGFFQENSVAKVYLQEEAKENCYAKILWFKQYIGIPESILTTFNNRFVYVNKNTEVAPGVWLIRHTTKGLERIAKKAHFYREGKMGLRADDLLHEQSLVFVENECVVILNSCCHAGVDHVVEEVLEVFPGHKVLAMIGGFHLMGLRGPKSKSISKRKIETLGQRLIDLRVQEIYTGHCTGDPAFEILYKKFSNQIHHFHAGDSIEIRS
jgi:7,8-dihydropterin-6-yl-methyl-4-(beta-D-ribofuranosyl)aminobenzene 5'-phosphate synthase